MKRSVADIVDAVISALGKVGRRKYTSAVILAGGDGERFGGEVPKQLFVLDGLPIVVRTLLAFEKCEFIDEIVLVSRESDIPTLTALAEEYGISKLTKTVHGGATRQESALAGFDAISDKAEYVAFHDAARCLVTDEIIRETVADAYSCGAAASAEKPVDTVKLATPDGYIKSTVDRREVRLVKTPQVFLANMYRAAAYTAKKDGIAATDDCFLAERLGFKVRLTDCGHENIKITTCTDISIAEGILAERRKKEESSVEDRTRI